MESPSVSPLPFALDSISVATAATTSTSVSTLSQSQDDHNNSDQLLLQTQLQADDGLMIDTVELEWDDKAPAPCVSPDEIESLMAHQMSALSVEDRDKVYHDLYGITPAFTETPELLQARLAAMEDELEQLHDIPAYDMAVLLDRDYVTKDEFRLRFLRADLLDAKKAAHRMARHFKAKMDLFGRDKLVKDITQDDLDDATLAALYSGYCQFLPLRDRAGRMVHVQFVVPPTIDLETKLKIDFYMVMVKSEDIETQRKGCVGIRYFNGQWLQAQQQQQAQPQEQQPQTNNCLWQAPQLLTALPLRPSAMHLCHDSKSIWSPVFAVMKYVLGYFVRNRTREHYGTHEHNLFQLQTYGIITSPSCFPLDLDGKILLEYHHELWRKRRNLERLREEKLVQKEQQQEEEEEDVNPQEQQSQPTPADTNNDTKNKKNKSTVVDPEPFSIAGQNDVLLGRGKRFYEHSGNIRFRYMVEHQAADYNATASASAKKRITSDIVAKIHQTGGRFLKDDRDAGWIEVDDETARLKVSHVFRNMRLSKHNNNNTAACSNNHHENNNKGARTKRAREEDVSSKKTATTTASTTREEVSSFKETKEDF
ncbi:Transfer protein [Seminavis robusta]|uniref:Transfer protein n=1 Tax=Seminavis robusta TaxID=568900 RepID=A0A9N8ELC0_9STRA|nr:Transfer protein [Seminavis robusta]|eukprot:Sro1190_g250810.1 Transfer protein (595) ;mRNA; f:19557-21341